MPTKSTAVEKAAPTDVDLGINQEELDALLKQQQDEFGDDLLTAPILKIAQPLTREVQDGNAEPGEFVNSLTGEGIGDKLEFIVAYYQKGRFAVDRDSNKAFVAFGPVIPESWADLVGEQFVGTPFDEYDDAEERYKERVNAKEIPWGKGPLVSTTHNFTGLAIISPPEGSDEEPTLEPVRLSLQRTNMPAVRKWTTLLRTLRNKAQWDVVFELGTYKKQFDRGAAHLLEVKQGRKTEPDERRSAVELMQAVAAGRVLDNQASDSAIDKAAKPDSKGGLEV